MVEDWRPIRPMCFGVAGGVREYETRSDRAPRGHAEACDSIGMIIIVITTHRNNACSWTMAEGGAYRGLGSLWLACTWASGNYCQVAAEIGIGVTGREGGRRDQAK